MSNNKSTLQPKVLIKNDNGVLYVVGATHQMEIHVIESDDLEKIEDDAGRISLIVATQHVFLHPEEIIRGDFGKFVTDYINDEI
jgi:hypothetical protein